MRRAYERRPMPGIVAALAVLMTASPDEAVPQRARRALEDLHLTVEALDPLWRVLDSRTSAWSNSPSTRRVLPRWPRS